MILDSESWPRKYEVKIEEIQKVPQCSLHSKVSEEKPRTLPNRQVYTNMETALNVTSFWCLKRFTVKA